MLATVHVYISSPFLRYISGELGQSSDPRTYRKRDLTACFILLSSLYGNTFEVLAHRTFDVSIDDAQMNATLLNAVSKH